MFDSITPINIMISTDTSPETPIHYDIVHFLQITDDGTAKITDFGVSRYYDLF